MASIETASNRNVIHWQYIDAEIFVVVIIILITDRLVQFNKVASTLLVYKIALDTAHCYFTILYWVFFFVIYYIERVIYNYITFASSQ